MLMIQVHAHDTSTCSWYKYMLL